MKIFFYDNYQDEGCSFCGDDGARYGLVATVNFDFPLTAGSTTPKELKETLRYLSCNLTQIREAETLIEKHPNAKIEII